MKKLLITPLLLLLLSSCDKIDKPLQNYVPPEVPQRKVLLEDYTGHTCGNCPSAAEVAANLEKKYGSELVVVAVHAGYFSKTSSSYPNSYTTTAGNAWNDHYLGISASYPIGILNRKNYGDGITAAPSKWASVAELGFKDDFVMDLDILPQYNSSARSLNVDVKAKFHKSYNSDVMVSVLLLEDSIIGPQTDYRFSPSKISDYVFMHMLRTTLNGTWGTELKAAPASAQDSTVVSFNNFAVDTAYNAKNLSIVAFTFDKNTREVLEVEKAKITSTSNK